MSGTIRKASGSGRSRYRTTRRRFQRGHGADEDHRAREHGARAAQPPVGSDIVLRHERGLDDEQQHPRAEQYRVGVHERRDRTAAQRFERASAEDLEVVRCPNPKSTVSAIATAMPL